MHSFWDIQHSSETYITSQTERGRGDSTRYSDEWQISWSASKQSATCLATSCMQSKAKQAFPNQSLFPSILTSKRAVSTFIDSCGGCCRDSSCRGYTDFMATQVVQNSKLTQVSCRDGRLRVSDEYDDVIILLVCSIVRYTEDITRARVYNHRFVSLILMDYVSHQSALIVRHIQTKQLASVHTWLAL